jgi:hypothetical protein
VQVRHFEKADGGNSNRVAGFGAVEQLARLPSDAPFLRFYAPDPNVRVEQEHSSVAMDVVVAVDGIERPVVFQH